jgi:hypothetical protein
MLVTGGNDQTVPGGDVDLPVPPIMEWIPALFH